jgi:hypothetical protein
LETFYFTEMELDGKYTIGRVIAYVQSTTCKHLSSYYISKRYLFRRGCDKALSEGGAVDQTHKRIALLRFACL